MNDRDRARMEAERYQAARKQIEACGLRDFFDWLCEPHDLTNRQVQLCWRWPGIPEFRGGDWRPVGDPGSFGEKIFAAYFEIDLDLVEQHRLNILEELRKSGE